jgi:O-antigen ligase
MTNTILLPKTIARLYKFLVFVIFAMMVVGSFSLDRFISETAYVNGEAVNVDQYRNTILSLTTSMPFLTEIRFWLILILLIAFIASRHIAILPRVPVGVKSWSSVVALLHLYMLAAVFWAPDTEASALQVIALLSLIIIILLASSVFALSFEDHTHQLFILIYGAAIAFALGGIFGPSTQEGRMSAFLGGPNVFVRWEASGVFCAVYFWLIKGKYQWLFPVPVFLSCIVLSGSRGGMLSFTISSILMMSLLIYFKYLKLRRVLIFTLIFGIFIAGVLEVQQVSEMWVSRFLELTLDAGYLSGRDDLLLSSWEMFLTSPLFGVGVDGFRQISGIGEYPHNIVLTFASEGGLVALVLFFIALGKTVLRWFKAKSILQVLCFVQAIFYLLASLFSGYYYDARLMWLFFLLYMMPYHANTFAVSVVTKEISASNEEHWKNREAFQL